MASPTIESLCCITTNNAFSKDFLQDFQSVPYNLVSIVASVFGIAGATYQILPRTSGNGTAARGGRFFRTRGRVIIKWLAAADLMASLGILIRSASWLADDTFGSKPDDSPLGQYLCIITSGMIHYFYTATYCWTFLYALDVKLVMQEKRVSHQLYHLISWMVPLALCLTGLLILYLPDLNCHSKAVNPYMRFLPNYLSSFLPIVVVMIGNPILYCISFSGVEKQIMSARGRFTHAERRVVDGLLKKFFLINAVFYLCWLPNIVNGIVLWTAWDNLPRNFVLVVWYLMAILNPLQAVFNCMVYRAWDTGSVITRPGWFPQILWPKSSAAYQQMEPPPTTMDETIDNPVDDDGTESRESPIRRSSFTQMVHERSPLLPPAPSKGSIDQSSDEILSSSFSYKSYNN
ncbi:G-protein coupled receptor 143-like [Macrobrachium nipponense]|uniref:G-protein coupled receptor 143-like n=1 Tax=Macrobrachium nipponense TaxID=159736 RepID=UPI0030C8056F